MSEENKNCRRCSKPIGEIKSCGEKDCPYWNPRDLNRPSIEKLGIELPDKYFVENLCNSCSKKLEEILDAFYNCKIGANSTKELEQKSGGKLTYEIEGGQEGKFTHNSKTQMIKIWEESRIYEFDLKEKSLESILNSMNF